MRTLFSRRYFVKQIAVVGTGLITFGNGTIVRTIAGKKKKKAHTNTLVLSCAGSTPTSIDIDVCARSGKHTTGAPAGFSVQWMTTTDYAANGNVWYSLNDPRLCKAEFSGQAVGSRYKLKPGGCATVRVGNLTLDSGASTNCANPLVPGTEYVFRASAHANNGQPRTQYTGNLTCSTLAVTSSFKIPVNAADPLLLRAIATDGQIIDFVGTRDATGVPLSLNLIEIRPPSDDGSANPLRYLLDSDHRPVRIHNSDGTQFDFTWITATQVALAVLTPDGQTQVNTFVDLSLAPSAPGSSSIASPIPSGAIAVVPTGGSTFTSNTAPRGGQRVILQHGGSPSAAAVNGIAAMTVASSSVNVQVDGCGGLPTDGDVYVKVLDTQGVFLGQYPATRVSQGNYVAGLPSGLAPTLNPGEICGTLATVLGATCDWLIDIPGAPQYLCAALTIAVAATGVGAVVAGEIAAACEAVTGGLELYCKTLNTSGAPGSPSLADVLCESEALDRTFTADVLLVPIVIALPTNIVGSPLRAPGNGPFPDLLVDLGIHTTIRSLTLNPANPVAQQSYVATADIFCLPFGTVVTLSIIGTDGYTDSVSTTINTTQESGTFTLSVPGAANAGIRDVDTVTVVLPDGEQLTLNASLVFG